MTGREALVKALMEELDIPKEAAQNIIDSSPLPSNVDDEIGTEEEIAAKAALMKLTPAAQARYELLGRRDSVNRPRAKKAAR